MPLKFNNSDEARKFILDESKKWRASLEKAKTSKDGAKETATVMVNATDALVSAQTHTIDAVMVLQREQAVVQGGLEKANTAMDMLSAENTTIKDTVNRQERDQEAAAKEADKAAVRAKAHQNWLYRLQLERSQAVIVIRNLPPMTNARETYDDMEKAVLRMLKELHINRDGIRINSVRRLQRSKQDRSGDHPALRVELGGVGDKIKIYQAVDMLIKGGKRLTFQINNEIPEYAIKAYKTQCRVATHIHKRDPNIKTRVGIERGDIWPTITMKKRGGAKYGKVLEELYTRAREEVAREKKAEAEKKKKDKEDRLLEGDDDDMDTDKPG